MDENKLNEQIKQFAPGYEAELKTINEELSLIEGISYHDAIDLYSKIEDSLQSFIGVDVSNSKLGSDLSNLLTTAKGELKTYHDASNIFSNIMINQYNDGYGGENFSEQLFFDY